jgi:hypothetical protein
VKVIRNDSYIEKRGKIGRYTSLGGLVVLLAGMLISIFRPEFLTYSFVCLLAGFALSQIGIYYGNRFVRPDRPDEALTKALKGLDDRYRLYHYQLPTPHVLLAPSACYVLSVYPQSGRIMARQDRWRQALGWRWLFAWLGQEGIGNPTKTTQYEVRSFQQYLAKKLPNVEVSLTPLIVFSHPSVELDVADMSVPVVHVKKLKDWLRGSQGDREQGLTSEVRAQLLQAFEKQG